MAKGRAQTTARAAEPSAPAGGGRRVLAIDDDPRILEIYRVALGERGLAVTTCNRSTDVVAMLKAGAYDAVLMDLQMPGLEGTDLLPLIKKLHPELPVIIISAYCDDTNAAYHRALGAFDMISKPFSHERLFDTLNRAMEQNERIPVLLSGYSLRDGRDQVYRKLILAALRKADWNQVRAAALLGVSRYCLIRWLKRLGISY